MSLPAKDQKHIYEFRNKTANSAEILLYGPIGVDFWGDGISAKAFTKELKALGNVRTIDLHIDSPGGSVTDARTIYTQLTQHTATINVKIDGFAASAASFVAMSGDNISIAEGGFFMIHNARGVVAGDYRDMEKANLLLRSINDTIVDTYAARTKLSRKKLSDWMDEETWFTGSDAVKHGFADTLMANKQLTNCVYNWSEVFKNVPRDLHPSVIRARRIRNRIEARKMERV